MATRSTELTADEAAGLLLDRLARRACGLVRVGGDRNLILGFGAVRQSRIRPRAEVELGVEDCAWRVSRGAAVLCGRNDAVDAVAELQDRLSAVDVGRLVAVDELSGFDVRFRFSSGLNVDVLTTVSDDDDTLNVFFTDEVLAFSPARGWRFGRSDEPWA